MIYVSYALTGVGQVKAWAADNHPEMPFLTCLVFPSLLKAGNGFVTPSQQILSTGHNKAVLRTGGLILRSRCDLSRDHALPLQIRADGIQNGNRSYYPTRQVSEFPVFLKNGICRPKRDCLGSFFNENIFSTTKSLLGLGQCRTLLLRVCCGYTGAEGENI